MADHYHDVTIYTDGACSGNPGPAGIGVVMYHDGQVIQKISKPLGEATNNIAEYTALIYGLQEALKYQARTVHVYTDSELMFKQIQGVYKVKHPNIKPLFEQIMHLKEGFEQFYIQHVLREKNKEADKLATDAVKALSEENGFQNLETA